MQKLIPAFLSMTLLSSCLLSSNDGSDAAKAMSPDSMKQNIMVLASDTFMGRKPFTEGETKTVAFLENKFAALGLEPGNGNSYVQEVPMVSIATESDPYMRVQSPKGSSSLKFFDEYGFWTQKTDSVISIDNAELVFAGYGVVAPEYNWNDYDGIDVKGKIVMVMVNDPGFWIGDTSLFKGKEMTYYGRWTYKFEEAARQGAKGCLVIHNTAAASYPWSVAQNNFNQSRLNLAETNGVPVCDAVGWITEAAVNKLFSEAGFDSSLFVKANKQGFKAINLNLRASTKLKVKAEYKKSINVIARITGSKRPDEVIIYSAHWDHLGIGKPGADGDSIYNGALDNATGTAALIELARAFQHLKEKPERTIVMLAVTAEEQGLLGSEYYASHPVYPAEKTVANINMDGVNPFGKTLDMSIVGQGQSEIEDLAKQELEKDGRYAAPDPKPEAGSYYRSDHFNFAKKGIPALYLKTGIDVVGKGKEYGKQIREEYNSKNYHQTSDEIDPATWTMEGAMQDLAIYFRVGLTLAREEKFPQWKAGSEFKAIREGKK
ncbi:MAG TPA: M28 family metallopeptidase [Chitinophagaceae bacterium]|nr:M28 family metallopeptidase [Chitinophagaceae bacterium]